MRFNELEMMTWILITLLYLNVEPEPLTQVNSMFQLVFGTALFTKAFMQAQIDAPDGDTNFEPMLINDQEETLEMIEQGMPPDLIEILVIFQLNR